MFGNNDQNFNNNFNNNNNYNGNSIMNNNQNFNNPGYNSIPPFENNNQNMGYPGSAQNPWTQQNTMSGFPNQGMMNQPVDIPPVLDPIKPLSDTKNTVAPSMDALNPMNIMPDTLPPSPPLEQSLASSPVEQMESNNFNYNNGLNNDQLNSLELNTPMNNSLNTNNPLSGEQINNMPLGNGPINDYNQTSVDKPTVESQTPIQNLSQPFENNYNNVSNMSSSPVMDNQFNSPLSNDVSPSYPQMNQSNIMNSQVENTETSTLNKIDEVTNQGVSDFSQMQINEPASQVTEDAEDNDDLDDASSNNVEISDIKLSDDNTKEDINNLGLDSSYTEPDMLEIMDLEASDEPTNSIEEVSKTQENDLEPEEKMIEDEKPVLVDTSNIKESVEKIKGLIEEIKYSGIKIELEEFDFEEMYQLVVKINK